MKQSTATAMLNVSWIVLLIIAAFLVATGRVIPGIIFAVLGFPLFFLSFFSRAAERLLIADEPSAEKKES